MASFNCQPCNVQRTSPESCFFFVWKIYETVVKNCLSHNKNCEPAVCKYNLKNALDFRKTKGHVKQYKLHRHAQPAYFLRTLRIITPINKDL